MINFSKQVPSIYPNASRDFQYLGWLIDIVLNSVKHNVDALYSLPVINDDTKLTELLALTLGFKVKRNYDKRQLAALVSVLPSILKYKGTETAIVMAAEALIKSSGASGDFTYKVNGAHLDVTFPEDLVDTSLFTDLLAYILPAGMTCRIIRDTQIKAYLDDVLLGFKDTVQFAECRDLAWDNTNMSAGLSSLFDPEIQLANPDFASNFKLNENGKAILNAGLLNNTVIPVLTAETQITPTEKPIRSNLFTSNDKIIITADEKVVWAKETEES